MVLLFEIWRTVNYMKPEYFGLMTPVISIIIAVISLCVALEALAVTRRTQRPFLKATLDSAELYNNPGIQTTPINFVKLEVSNIGNYPADEFSLLCGIAKKGSSDNFHSLSLSNEHSIPLTIFPGERFFAKFEEKPNDNSTIKFSLNNDLLIQISLFYQNRLTGRKHKTLITFNRNGSQVKSEWR
jgi:hypothetical protein